MNERDEILDKFIDEISDTFPEVSIRMAERIEDLGFEPEDKPHTMMMEGFSEAATDALRNHDDETYSKYLMYMSQKLSDANDIEREYIDVYFVEPLMWDINDLNKLKRGWELMPENLRELYYKFWGRKSYYEGER